MNVYSREYFSVQFAKRVNIVSDHQKVDPLLEENWGRHSGFYLIQFFHKHLYINRMQYNHERKCIYLINYSNQ